MATNPRIPGNRNPESNRDLNVIRGRKRPGSAWNGLVMGLAIVVVLLAVIIYFLPRAPKATRPSPGAEVPAQATGAMLQIQGVQMAMDPTGRSLTLQGRMFNNGTQTVTGAMMHVQFLGANGANAGSADVPVEILQTSGKGTKAKVTASQTLTDAPLKPNDAREFQVQINNVPQSWNHQMPQVSFTQVASHP